MSAAWARQPPAAVARRLLPLIVLLLVSGTLVIGRGEGRPSPRDDAVFLQAAWLVRTEDVSTIEAVTRAAENQFGWGGELSERLRSDGDIQTYALVPVWSRLGGFETKPSPWGRPLYVESPRISRLSQLGFLAAVFLLYWAALPLGRGVALVAALALALGHPFRHGPALFDPWVMPGVAAAIGWWLRDRHVPAALAAVAVVMIKPNYLFLLPAFFVASLVRPGRGDPAGRAGVAPAAVHAAGAVAVVAAYLALSALDVIWADGYAEGVQAGWDPAVLGYSLAETLGFTYRAGTQQFREHWPLFPWTVLNLAALALLARHALIRRRLPRTAALVLALIVVPVLANFAVIGSVDAYEDGGHFRWLNVSIMGMALALPLAYREVARLVAARADTRPAAEAARAVGAGVP